MPTTPHSAAGWRIEPPVSEPSASGAKPAATAAAEPPDRAAGHPVGVVGVAGRAEGRVLGGRAHGELVEVGLADDDGAGGPQPRRPRWRRRAGASPRGSATSRWWAPPGCTGCPSAPPARRPAGPGSSPAATARSTAGRLGPGRVGGDQVRRRGARRRRRRWRPGAPRPPRRPDRAGPDRRLARLEGRRGASSRRLPQDARHPEPAVLDRRRLGQHLVPVEAGPRLVGPEHVAQRQRVGGGLDARRCRGRRPRRRGRAPRPAAR